MSFFGTEILAIKGLILLVKAGKLKLLAGKVASIASAYGVGAAAIATLKIGAYVGGIYVTAQIAEYATLFVRAAINGDKEEAAKYFVYLAKRASLGVSGASTVINATIDESSIHFKVAEKLIKFVKELARKAS